MIAWVEMTYHKVRILTTGHLVVEHGRVACAHVRLEALVQDAHLAPVQVERLDVRVADARPELGLLERGAHRAHRRLRRQAGHACGESHQRGA